MKFGFGLSALREQYPGVDAHYLRMPYVEKGMAVGLFGGSFNPPHGGHALVAEIAIRRLKLDQLWWMVTPGNPLKDSRELAPLADRLKLSEEIASDPRIKVTALEAAFNGGYAGAYPRCQSRRPFRLGDGGGQSCLLPSLAALARDRAEFSDCGYRPAGFDAGLSVVTHGADILRQSRR